MVKYVHGDLFTAIADAKQKIIIPHVVNHMGAWGAGFVIPLAKHFPAARVGYFASQQSNKLILGHTVFLNVGKQREVANMCAQAMGVFRPLYYNHLARCMDSVAERLVEHFSHEYRPEIHSPKFGSGLAGGDWNIISLLIEDCWERRGLSVTIYEV